jgi:hypothetical protein
MPWLRLPLRDLSGLVISLSWVYLGLALLLTLAPTQTLAQSVASYQGDIQLPVDLYTSDGVRLAQGRFDLEVRSDDGHYSLLFLDKTKTVARLSGQTVSKGPEDSKQSCPCVPLVGTTLLWPNKPTEKGKTTAAAPHLPYLSWKATLRVYKSTDPSDKTVRFAFQEKQDSGQEIRVQFSLLLK